MSYEHHGDTGTRLYRIWKSMKSRCNLRTHPTYKDYGGRGITICREWQESYIAFREWALSHGYTNKLELERENVNKGYNSENCKWISHYEQTLNRRDTLYITIGRKTIKLREFCRSNHISVNTVNNWRHLNILEDKLSQRIGIPVVITGGKRGLMYENNS